MHISTKEHIISVALLHHNLSLSSLQALYEALRARFAYFEIVLLNPTLESENNPPLESTLPSQATRSPSSRADEALFLSSRASVAIHTQNKDSSRGAMDCHATASAVSRNDNKNAVFQKMDSSNAPNLNKQAQDSRIFTQNAKNSSKSQAEGFCDDFGGFQGAGAGIYLGDNEQARAAESTKSAQKPTPTSPKIQYLRLHQKGVGLALQAGIDHNAALPRPCEFIGYMDIDLSTDLTHLLEVYDKLCQGHPIVVGSRLLQGSQVIGRKLLRELTSKTLNTIIKAALHTSFSDAMCGFKFYRADIAALLRQQCSDDPSWFYCAQMLIQAQALGIEIEEIPVRWEDDALGSKVQVAKLARIYLKEIYRLRHLRRAILAHKS